MSDVKRVNLELSDGPDRKSAFETDHLQLMRIRLQPGESLPHHKSNSNVLLIPLSGSLRLKTPDSDNVIEVGEALSVPFDAPMDVSNAGEEELIFFVVKTPHPKAFL